MATEIFFQRRDGYGDYFSREESWLRRSKPRSKYRSKSRYKTLSYFFARSSHIFILYKFRSMATNTSDLPSALMKGNKITFIGKIIRRTNIDELPQLINILRGHMSIVGPRPALVGQIDLIKMRMVNHSINLRPGLTGLAQINSYDNMSENEKSKFDGTYASQYSLWLDLIIIFHTFKYLLKKPPIY